MGSMRTRSVAVLISIILVLPSGLLVAGCGGKTANRNTVPVVFVHGWNEGPDVWDYMVNSLEDKGMVKWDGWGEITKNSLLVFDYGEYTTEDPRNIAEGKHDVTPFAENYIGLDDFIDDKLGSWIKGGGRIDIVCHSMGALVSRWWMEELDNGKNAASVRQWIGIAPATHGSATADFVIDKVGEDAGNIFQQAMVQLQTNSDTVTTLDKDGIQEGLSIGVKYHVLVGVNYPDPPKKDFRAIPAILNDYVLDLDGKTFDREAAKKSEGEPARTYLGDGLVSMNQSMLTGATNEYFEKLDHNQILKDADVCETVWRYLIDPSAALDPARDCLDLTRVSRVDTDGKGSDTALVMDISGSMGDSMEGKSKLFNAQVAAKDLLGTIRNESMYGEVTHMVGLVTFTDNAHIDSSLTSSYQSMESIISGLTPQNSTNLEDGIKQGTTVLKKSGTGRKRIMVLLSDGLPTSGETNEKLLLSGCVENAKQAGVVINTVGFGSDCDEELLQKIANSTSGTYAYASNSFELLSAYIHIRHDSMGEVVLSENDTIAGSASKSKSFQVASSAGELNGTINWKGSTAIYSQLYDPKGRLVNSTYPGAVLSRGSNYEQLIIRNPMIGNWELDVGLGAVPSRISYASPLVLAGTAFPGVYKASHSTLNAIEAAGGSGEGAEFHVEVSTRGEKSEADSYPKVLWIVLGICALVALLLFLVFNRRISLPMNTRGRGGAAV